VGRDTDVRGQHLHQGANRNYIVLAQSLYLVYTVAVGREAAVLGDTLQWAAFEGPKFGILASALRRFSVSLYLVLIYTVH